MSLQRSRDRFLQDQVDELDDGGIAFLLAHHHSGSRFGFGQVDLRIGEFRDHRVDGLGFGLSIMPVDGLDDLLASGKDRRDFLVQDEIQLLHGVVIGRIAQDDLERAVFLAERNDHVFAGHRFGNELDDGRGNRHVGEIDKLQAVILGHRSHDVVLGGVTELDEGIGQLGAGLLHQFLRFRDLIGADNALLDENIGKIAAFATSLGHVLDPLMDDKSRMTRLALTPSPYRSCRAPSRVERFGPFTFWKMFFMSNGKKPAQRRSTAKGASVPIVSVETRELELERR